MIAALVNEWFKDISTNQVHTTRICVRVSTTDCTPSCTGLAYGVILVFQMQANKFAPNMTPFRSLYSLSNGASRLFSEPIKSYQNDGQVWKGIFKGVYQAFRSVGVEVLDVSAAMTSTIERSLKCAERAVDDNRQEASNRSMTVGSGISTASNDPSNVDRFVYVQPASTSQGIVQAGRKLEEGIDYATKRLLSDPVRSFQKKGFGEAVVTIVRGIPAATVAPVKAVAGAINQASLGLRNSMEPSRRLS